MKIGGERAYRLARRGVAVEMPLRRSQVYALDVLAYNGERASRLELHVELRDLRPLDRRRRSAATAGRCGGRRSGRSVEEADAERLLPVAEALARLPAEALGARAGAASRERVLAVEAAGRA